MTATPSSPRQPRKPPRRLTTAAASTKREFLPPKIRDLFFEPDSKGNAIYIPSRYKVAYGGRGSGKSWAFAALALVLGTQHPLRVLCAREFQTSIRDSIYKLVTDLIERFGMGGFYEVQANSVFGPMVPIKMPDGTTKLKRTEFIFAGIKTDPLKIKSMESIDICLVEEAERVSAASWRYLLPTIRTEFGSSEIWVVFNPRQEDDETYRMFISSPPSDMRRVMVNWNDNPWFPHELRGMRLNALRQIKESSSDDDRLQAQAEYDHIWEGALQKNSAATIFRRRVIVHEFDDPHPDLQTRYYYGADFGFANDPSTLIRFWITTHRSDDGEREWEELWISHEAFGWRVEIDETPAMYDLVPGSREWPIKGDCSRPETISYLARQGFNISEAEKWPGSVEDGIAHIKAFERIHIHERCVNMQEEARLYSYKVDKITEQVLPIVVSAHDHGWDAIRYGLDGVIQRRGAAGQWARLGA